MQEFCLLYLGTNPSIEYIEQVFIKGNKNIITENQKSKK